jgi:hypothetical protein
MLSLQATLEETRARQQLENQAAGPSYGRGLKAKPGSV